MQFSAFQNTISTIVALSFYSFLQKINIFYINYFSIPLFSNIGLSSFLFKRDAFSTKISYLENLPQCKHSSLISPYNVSTTISNLVVILILKVVAIIMDMNGQKFVMHFKKNVQQFVQRNVYKIYAPLMCQRNFYLKHLLLRRIICITFQTLINFHTSIQSEDTRVFMSSINI